jgi:hypothetical protein
METQPAREARRCRRSKRFAEKKFDDTWPSGQRRDPAPINPHRYTDADANWADPEKRRGHDNEHAPGRHGRSGGLSNEDNHLDCARLNTPDGRVPF